MCKIIELIDQEISEAEEAGDDTQILNQIRWCAIILVRRPEKLEDFVSSMPCDIEDDMEDD